MQIVAHVVLNFLVRTHWHAAPIDFVVQYSLELQAKVQKLKCKVPRAPS